jgi:hypothetical protein
MVLVQMVLFPEPQTPKHVWLFQEFLPIGYKELNIPANADGTHKLDKNSFHIWPRGEYMLIALANLDGSFTCTLFMPFRRKFIWFPAN